LITKGQLLHFGILLQTNQKKTNQIIVNDATDNNLKLHIYVRGLCWQMCLNTDLFEENQSTKVYTTTTAHPFNSLFSRTT